MMRREGGEAEGTQWKDGPAEMTRRGGEGAVLSRKQTEPS